MFLRVWCLQNVHQAGFMATRVQLETAAAAGCLTRVYEVPHWFYPRIETADSQLYFQCGFMKVVPLEVRSVVLQAVACLTAPGGGA